jgi:hypothetical protein
MKAATCNNVHRRQAEGEEESRWANKVNQLQKSVYSDKKSFKKKFF